MRSSVLHWCRVLLALLALLAFAAPARAADDDLEVVEVRADTFPRVVVRLIVPASGNGSAALTPEQFRVVEDGQPLPSVNFFRLRDPATPASVILAIDVSGSMAEQDKLPRAREAAKAFLGQLRKTDRVALLSFGRDVALRQPFTTDRQLMTRAIDGLTSAGDTSLYDGLARAVGEAATVSSGPRAVVLLTDGEDTQSASGLTAGIDLAARAGVPVYTIGLGAEVKTEILERIATETSGRMYHAPGSQDLAAIFELVSRRLTGQYELFWESRLQADGERDVPVQISLNAPGESAVAFSYRLPKFGRGLREPADVVRGGELAMLPAVAPPSQDQIVLAGMLASLTAVLLYAGFVRPRIGRHLEARLATYLAGQGAVGSGASAGSSLSARRAPVSPLVAVFARVAARLLPGRYLARLRLLLIQAGLPTERHLWMFLAVELASVILLSSAAYAVLYLRGGQPPSPLMGPLLIVVLAVLAVYLPLIWLRRRAASRRRALLRALPDALDLMVIGVSAGLSVDGAILEVVQQWEGELSRELNQVLTEMRLGASRREALLALAERTQLEDFQLLVAAMIQAEELGSNVTETLKVQAEQLRIRRRQQAEERARKAPVKMLFPMVGMIFPALFVVLLGPAALSIVRMFRGLTGG